MQKILVWEKPKKKMSTEEWKKITADGAPPGVYVPNMSQEDNLKWKAKHIKGSDERVEIRKSFYFSNGKKYPENVNYCCQTLIVVRKKAKEQPDILISSNGKMALSLTEFLDLKDAVQEAVEKML